MPRSDGRKSGDLRPLKIRRGYLKNADGSVMIEAGLTRVICTATVEETVPPFLRGRGRGWITAEYGMLPRSSATRIPRESIRGRVKGRTHEIQRLIGRSLRAGADLTALGERTIVVDCDVVEADGGTRTASIIGAMVALVDALRPLKLEKSVIRNIIAAVSVGVVGGRVLVDLDYGEDSTAEVDMNIVMDDEGRFVELQGTAEGEPFDQRRLSTMLKAGERGIKRIIREQKRVLRWR